MYALKIQTQLGHKFSMTKFGVVLAIMDVASAKANVNGLKNKYVFWQL